MPADIFSPLTLGALELPNRIVMAPMTRNRAAAGDVPTQLNATYYAQRASAGLIITEASQISPQGKGYPATPGIHSEAQVAGWRLVTDAVHAAGGRIYLQMWHVGRISHPSLQPDGGLPVAPSALKPAGKAMTATFSMVPYEMPRALEAKDIASLIEDYRRGAVNAKAAGFDGVEVHAANGYLLDQFLRSSTNRRTDQYGGSAENRVRLTLEVTQAVAQVFGVDRVGVRLSPTNPFNDLVDDNPAETFGLAATKLAALGLAYLHIVDPAPADPVRHGERPDAAFFRKLWKGPLMVNRAYDLEKANAAIASGEADLVSFAALYLANPDLPERFKHNGPFNPPDRATFYGGGEKGYTDYPAL